MRRLHLFDDSLGKETVDLYSDIAQKLGKVQNHFRAAAFECKRAIEEELKDVKAANSAELGVSDDNNDTSSCDDNEYDSLPSSPQVAIDPAAVEGREQGREADNQGSEGAEAVEDGASDAEDEWVNDDDNGLHIVEISLSDFYALEEEAARFLGLDEELQEETDFDARVTLSSGIRRRMSMTSEARLKVQHIRATYTLPYYTDAHMCRRIRRKKNMRRMRKTKKKKKKEMRVMKRRRVNMKTSRRGRGPTRAWRQTSWLPRPLWASPAAPAVQARGAMMSRSCWQQCWRQGGSARPCCRPSAAAC